MDLRSAKAIYRQKKEPLLRGPVAAKEEEAEGEGEVGVVPKPFTIEVQRARRLMQRTNRARKRQMGLARKWTRQPKVHRMTSLRRERKKLKAKDLLESLQMAPAFKLSGVIEVAQEESERYAALPYIFSSSFDSPLLTSFQPKLTEDELSARIAAAKLHAAKIAAAHARAEADQASFQEREKVAEEKRRQEFQNRRAMDNERERNRLRKLGAQTGREWDSTKREEDYNPRGGGSQYRRGMHGGVSGYTRHTHENGSDSGDSHRGGRGRGGRGGRGRGQRGGRGDHLASNGHDHTATTTSATTPSAPVINNDNEFPALPGSSTKEQGPGPTIVTGSTSPGDALSGGTKSPSALSPLTPSGGGSWAEQVESSGAAKA